MVDWRDFFSLDDEEYIVRNWLVAHKGNLWKGREDGVFVLTNKRIIFLESLKEGRILKRIESYKVMKEIPLESITDISWTLETGFSYGVRTKMLIHVGKDKHIFFISVIQTSGRLTTFFNFKETVFQKMQERRQELEKKEAKIVVDFSFIKTYLEKGGVVLTALKCPHCSAPIRMPKDGNETVCEHCGSTVYAQDVFEKVKKLAE